MDAVGISLWFYYIFFWSVLNVLCFQVRIFKVNGFTGLLWGSSEITDMRRALKKTKSIMQIGNDFFFKVLLLKGKAA